MGALFKQLFSKYLLFTNTITSGTLLGLGDVITQLMEKRYNELMIGVTTEEHVDWARAGRMFSMGLIIGPFGHFWYTKLADKLVRGQGAKAVLKKIAIDQIMFTPMITCMFFSGMGILEGRGVAGGIQEVKDNFIAVYAVDCCVWPLAQYINFNYIPAKFRSIYVSTLTLCWNTFLSYMKHRVDCCVWPLAQYINFNYIPAKFRSIYVSTLTLCWNTFLSYMKHRNVRVQDIEKSIKVEL